MRGWLLAAALLAGIAPALLAGAAPEPSLVPAARAEGKVVVYSVLSTKAARPLIDDFQALYPGIRVDYDGDKGSNEMDARFRSERAAGHPSADVVWSSSADMQMKLVFDGYAARYRSPQAGALPRWARYADLAYGTTLEPVVFVYNKARLAPTDVPRDHTEAAALLAGSPTLRGRVTGFDIAKSGVGLMFAVQDRQRLADPARMLGALGRACFTPTAGTGEMLTGIDRGKFLLGIDVMGAYALSRSTRDLPNLGVVFPRDYTLVLTRVAFVSKAAAHPAAARLWLDYLLSPRGQRVLGNSVDLFPIRRDVTAKLTAAGLMTRLGEAARPIPLTRALADTLKPARREAFIRDWTGGIAGARGGCD